MKRLVSATLASVAALGLTVLGLSSAAFAQGPTEKVRKINLYSWPQAALPQSYQAAQLIAQHVDVVVKGVERGVWRLVGEGDGRVDLLQRRNNDGRGYAHRRHAVPPDQLGQRTRRSGARSSTSTITP